MFKFLSRMVILSVLGFYATDVAWATAQPEINYYDGSQGIVKTTKFDTNGDDIYDTFQTVWTDMVTINSNIDFVMGKPVNDKDHPRPKKPYIISSDMVSRTFKEETYDSTSTILYYTYEKTSLNGPVYFTSQLNLNRTVANGSETASANDFGVSMVDNMIQVNYTIASEASVNISIYSAAGEFVATIADGKATTGTYTATYGTGNLSSGLYLVRIGMAGHVNTEKVIIAK